MKKSLFALVATVFLSMAFAFPPLQPYRQGNVSVNLPVSWQIQVDENQGMIYIRENPNDQNSAEIFMISGPNQNNITPKAMIEQAMQNIKDQGFANMTLLDSQELQGGLMAVVAGDKAGVAYKAAFVSFASGNMIAIAGFSTTANHFDDLGGAQLIFVTVGGQDPANYSTNTAGKIQQSTTTADPNCFNPNMDVIYNAEYCRFERALSVRQKIDPRYLVGAWSQATGVPMGDVYQNTISGDLSFDSMGSGANIVFYQNGNYDLLWLTGSTSAGCVNTIKVYESGQYSFDGLDVSLNNGTAKASSSICGGAYKSFNQNIIPELAKVVFVDADHLFLKLSCNARGYMEYSTQCNGLGENLVLLTRSK